MTAKKHTFPGGPQKRRGAGRPHQLMMMVATRVFVGLFSVALFAWFVAPPHCAVAQTSICAFAFLVFQTVKGVMDVPTARKRTQFICWSDKRQRAKRVD